MNQLTIEIWQLLAGLFALACVLAGMGKLLLVQFSRHTDSQYDAITKRLEGIERSAQTDAGRAHQLELELMKLRSELPMQYVMRDDYIRGQSIIEAKLDGLADKLEKAQLRGRLAQGSES